MVSSVLAVSTIVGPIWNPPFDNGERPGDDQFVLLSGRDKNRKQIIYVGWTHVLVLNIDRRAKQSSQRSDQDSVQSYVVYSRLAGGILQRKQTCMIKSTHHNYLELHDQKC